MHSFERAGLRAAGLAFWAVLLSSVRAPAQRAPVDSGVPLVVENARVFSVRSAINGREYQISVALPPSYAARGPGDTTRYPALYLLDGEMELPLAASMFRATNRGASGDVLLVGIGYPSHGRPGPPSGPDGVPYRRLDYTLPVSGGGASTDGAGAFLKVIKDEIIPFIDRRFRTTNDRGIHGHSLGGLFATYVLLTDPDVFSRYLITSPSLWWDSASIFGRETDFAKTRKGLAKRVYFSVGDTEEPVMVAGMWRMVAVLCRGVDDGPYRGLDVSAEALHDELHSSTVPISRALKAMYPPPAPNRPSGPRYCGKLTPLPY